MRRRWTGPGAALVGLVAWFTSTPGPLAGQAPHWTAGVTVSGARFGGASAEASPSPDGLRFLPYRPTFYGVFVERGSVIRVGLRLATGSPGVSLESGAPAGTGAAGRVRVVSDGAFNVGALGVSVSVPVIRAANGAALRLGVGGHWEHWSAAGNPGRGLAGLDGLALVELPLGKHWLTQVSTGVGFDPRSPFAAEDLPNGFRPVGMWRVGFGAGVGLRW